MKTLIILIVAFFSIRGQASCQSRISKEIPVDEKRNYVILYNLTKRYDEILGLPSLEKGYDSLELRIWMNYDGLKKTHLIIISSNKGQWTCTFRRLLLDRKSDLLSSYFLEKEEKKELVPKSGWHEFIKNMNELKIPLLRSYEYLPNYGTGLGGYYYMVEFATANTYRFYDYFNPQGEVKDYPEAAALEKFLAILEKEFSFKRNEIFE